MPSTMDTGQERAGTDAGRTGDKVRGADPAAAPLHTDAEAAGWPTSRAEALAALRQMTAWAQDRFRPVTFGAQRQPDEPHQRHLGRLLMVWTAVLCLAGIVMGFLSWPD